MNQAQFIKKSANPALALAVIKQIDGWEAFIENADFLRENSPQSGVQKFTYYNETVPFATANLNNIKKLLASEAQEYGMCLFGEIISNIVSQYNSHLYLKEHDLAEIIYARKKNHDDFEAVMNALAWNTLVAVSHEYCQLMESGAQA